jgi:hypothetical protein
METSHTVGSLLFDVALNLALVIAVMVAVG